MNANREILFRQAPQLFPLAEAQGHAFLISRFVEPHHHFLWHYHPETELVWVRRGHGLRYVGESVEAFKEGDLVLLGPDLPHTWSSAPSQKGSAEWTVIQFRPGAWGETFWHLPETQSVARLLAEASRGLQFTGPRRWAAGRRMEALAGKREHSFESLVGLLELLGELARLSFHPLTASPTPAGKTVSETRFEQALDLIHRRSSGPLAQAEVAAHVGMSAPAFSRWFRQHSGRVFQRYLNEVRVAHVCAHLASGAENVTEAAWSCGYNNLANFYRRFREIIELSPREFCRLNRRLQHQRTHELVIRLGRHGKVRIAPNRPIPARLPAPPISKRALTAASWPHPRPRKAGAW